VVEINAGDTAWVLVSAALVMLMTPAVGFFYGGLVRRKNVLAIMGQSFIILSIISIQWVLIGYSLVFGHSIGGIIGDLSFLGLNGVGGEPNEAYVPTIPQYAFVAFQMMFAIITPALIIGAFADRMKFIAFIAFILLWTTLVYDPVAHWVWGAGGWLKNMGALDFAGGTVVHITAGLSALAAALIIGKRLGYDTEKMIPHNIPFTLLGGAILWFGWFGFNAGSAFSSGALASTAFIVTNTAAAAAAIAWIIASKTSGIKPSLSGIVIGSVAGLVAITPASGFVSPLSAIIIGLAAGVASFYAIQLRGKTPIDDSLDVFACHGVGGILGSIAVGIFAEKTINEAGANGLLFGNASLLGVQVLAVLATGAYAFIATTLILFFLKFFIGLRVSKKEELEGLDAAYYGEEAYDFISGREPMALHVLSGVKVVDVMNAKVRTASPEDTLSKVQEMMFEKQHFAFPVLENELLAGVVTISDLKKISTSERARVKVSAVFTRSPKVAYPDETIHELVERMQVEHVSNMPVVDRNEQTKLLGIISKSDIIKAYKRIALENIGR